MHQKISKKTAQQIVETVKDICGHDINYIDLNGNIYASTDKSRIGKFHEIGKQVVLTGETIEVSDNNSFFGTHIGINIPIIYKGELIAVIGISGSPYHVRKYAYLAQKITLLLLREQELDYEAHSLKNRMNYVIRSIIDEEQSKNKRTLNYILEANLDTNTNYQVLLIELDKRYHPNNLAMIEETIFRAFESTGSSLYTFNYPSEYILIIHETILKNRRYIIEKLAKEHEKILKISTGSPHSIYEQYKSYHEAKIAMNSPSEQLITDYNCLGLEILCSNIDKELAFFYQNKFLSHLNEDDIVLLKTYYQNNMSLSKTSECLFLHKNTIQYQLDRIYKKSGFNPRVFKDAAGFYSALLIQN